MKLVPTTLITLILYISSCSPSPTKNDSSQYVEEKLIFICECKGTIMHTDVSWTQSDTIYSSSRKKAELECSNRTTTDLPEEEIICTLK
jgi:hypothetical protein